MNVLFHGRPFYTCEDILPLYRGEHDIRTFGIEDGKQYRYDPVHETFPEVFARISQEWQPDLIVCWGPEETPPPRGIEDAPVPTVAIVSDWDYHYANLEWNLARYDVALMDIAGARHFQRPWVSPRYQFPLYSQTSTIHKEYGERKDIDVLFVGSLAGGRNHVRARYIERLAQLADRYRIIATAGRYGQEYGRLMNRAKIVFNHTIRGELNLRFFETLAAGAAAFIEEDNLECSLYCEDGKNVVLYNERNMLEKIEYYLERPAELEAIARHGHRLAPDFAAENRLDAVIEWAARQPRGARRFRDLPPHEQDYHNVLLYKGNLGATYQEAQIAYLSPLLERTPNDPRLWAVETQRWYHYLALQATNAAADLNRFLNAAFKTLRLESSSGPYLLNVSTALLWSRRGSPLEQAKFLEIVLKTTSLSGAENLIGSFWDSFYTRWHRAVAEGNPRVEWLWAEAHIRLGQLDFQAEKFSRACEHFEQAEALDPENTNGMLSMAKALWQVDRRKAVQYLRERIHRLPLDTAAHLFLLEILVKEGFDNEAARVQYETIRMLNMMKGTLES